jgi:PBP1b-binding outer membrane lipoprotein LpoB
MSRMKMLKKATITLLFFSSCLSAYAGVDTVTPYGDYCKECATYGTCKVTLAPDEAIAAMEQYYQDKGYKVREVRHKGRFIEAEIYEGKRLVDKVLFDRKNGRIRSIY